MATMPFGALPDDTAEYMVGDVAVNVVLLESNATIAPNDPSTEDWDASLISNVKSKVESGVNWWKDTLVHEFPNVNPNILNFKFDYTYANSPVAIGYEPISRKSDDNIQWVTSFLRQTGQTVTGAIDTDIRAFNNSQRTKNQANWSFTIFVVNDTNDSDHAFASNGSLPYGFAYPGGRYIVIPASRPVSSYSHEVGHMFWAMDEYLGGQSSQDHRGYYDVKNANAANNTTPGFVQQPSIMSNGSKLTTAFTDHVSSDSTLAMIGWRDSDGDNIFDVLDVPFSLEGSGWFDEKDGTYKFLGNSSVRTLKNKNPEGLGNSTTINVIREAQYSLDGTTWSTIGTYNAYQTDLSLAFSIPLDAQQVRIRTIDTVTGVTSPEYVSNRPMNPSIIGEHGINGFVWNDTDYDGVFDPGEMPMVDVPVQLVDAQGKDLVLNNTINPDSYSEKAVLDQVSTEVTLSAIFYATGSSGSGEVVATTSTSAPTAGRVFGAPATFDPNFIFDTWNFDSRAFSAEFAKPTTTVSLRAWGIGQGSIGKMEAYNTAGELIGEYRTKFLDGKKSEMMTITRPQGDIAYIIAGGNFGRYVVLEDLEWGAKSRTTTNAQGAYWLSDLPAGTYNVKIPLTQFQILSTQAGDHVETILTASSAKSTSFGVIQLPNPWHNSAVGRKYDVNNNGRVEIGDVLGSVYYFNLFGGASLPNTGPAESAFVDIDNDGKMTIGDILQVVNKFNESLINSEPSSTTTNTPTGSSSGGGVTGLGGSAGGASGETPLEHFVDVPSDHIVDEHDHGPDVVVSSSAAGEGNIEAAWYLGLLNLPKEVNAPSDNQQNALITGNNSSTDTEQDSALLALLDEPLI